MRRALLAFVLLMGLVVVFATGCGSSTVVQVTTSPLAKAQYTSDKSFMKSFWQTKDVLNRGLDPLMSAVQSSNPDASGVSEKKLDALRQAAVNVDGAVGKLQNMKPGPHVQKLYRLTMRCAEMESEVLHKDWIALSNHDAALFNSAIPTMDKLNKLLTDVTSELDRVRATYSL
jgi:hypothetical protein